MANEYGTDTMQRMEVDMESGWLTGRRENLTTDREAIKKVGALPATSFVGIKENATSERIIDWYNSANNEPDYLISLIKNNPILLGLLTTKASIAYGKGPALYQGEQRLEVDEWPEPIRGFYEKTGLDALCYDLLFAYYALGNAFAQLRFNKGSPVEDIPKRVIDIRYLRPETVRAALPRNASNRISHYYVSPEWAKEHFDMTTIPRIRAFSLRDYYRSDDTFSNEVSFASVLWHWKPRRPGFPHYGIPGWYGGRRFIELHNHVPVWHIANITNMFGARVVVYISHAYIRAMQNEIKPGSNPPRNFTRREVKDHVKSMVRDYLTNPENAGRTMVLEHDYDPQGRMIKHIQVESIKLDLGDEVYTSMLDKLNEVVTSGIGIDPSIAGIIMNGKLSSGSEKRNAWNLELMKAHQQQQELLKLLGFIHRFNGWDPSLHWRMEPHAAMVPASQDRSGMQDPEPEPEPSDE